MARHAQSSSNSSSGSARSQPSARYCPAPMRTPRELLSERLRRHLVHPSRTLSSPAGVVAWFGAVQSQDYGGAKWAVGQRLPNAVDAQLDQALAEGSIVRTHVLRPTWHLVAREDLRWLLALSAPRVHAKVAARRRELGLTEAVIARAVDVMRKALAGGAQLTREELRAALAEAGIETGVESDLAHLTMVAELDAVICSGALRGKQHTYALFDARVPKARALKREDALAELTRRYFTSHGPATAKDFAWWSGLTLGDVRTGIERQDPPLKSVELGGQTYWFAPLEDTGAEAPRALLLPNYDEYLVAYEDRAALLDAPPPEKLDARGNVLFNNTLVLDGSVVGSWKRTLKKREVLIEVTAFARIPKAASRHVTEAAERYGAFLGLTPRLRIS
ncbi:MAG TPA: winged helix DNA-binding domain-containing protein [Myxococcaceae bacterium]|nr:winged helix DNA-binding domain-containing protein [Myxococcaceae bacterium]